MPEIPENTAPQEIHRPEQVLWTGRRSNYFYLGHWLLTLVLAAAVGFGIYYERVTLAPWLPLAYGVPLIVLVIGVFVIAYARGVRRFRVTNHRVIAEFGRFVRDSNEIRVQDIRSINVSKSGLSGLLGIGKVEFSSAATDDADVIFYQIGGADAVRDLVRRLQN